MIEYKGTPLFGEGSSVSHTSEFFAIAGTVLFWLIFLIFSFVIKPQPKKKYKEVQIVLSSTPVVQKSQDASAPAEAASASAANEQSEAVVEAPAVKAPAQKSEPLQKPAESSKSKAQTQPKKEPAKTQTTEPSSTPIYKTNEQLLEEQLRNKKIRDENYDPWANESDEEIIKNEDNKVVVKKENKLEGNAGSIGTNKTGGKLSSEKESNKENNNITQGDTLKKIRDAKEIDNSNIGTEKSPEKLTGKDKNQVVRTDGAGSRTYYNFDTELSANAKNSMQVSKPTPFTVTFSVDSEGNVMSTTIEIKNDFMLTDIIKKEMKEKISSWKFEKGNGISKIQFDWVLSPVK